MTWILCSLSPGRISGDNNFDNIFFVEASEPGLLWLNRSETEIEKYQTYAAYNQPHVLNRRILVSNYSDYDTEYQITYHSFD